MDDRNEVSTTEMAMVGNEVDAMTEREDAMVKRSKGNDASQALVSQSEAAKRCTEDSIRKFVKVCVEVETIGGKPLIFSVWASEEKPVNKKRLAEGEMLRSLTCEFCSVSFDSDKKLQLHLKSHGNSPNEPGGPISCAVCGKSFDEQRKLKLHSRHHKVSSATG